MEIIRTFLEQQSLLSMFLVIALGYAIGYGDLRLVKPWRILGPIEGLTGILMSCSLFFGLVTRIYSSRLSPRPNPL